MCVCSNNLLTQGVDSIPLITDRDVCLSFPEELKNSLPALIVEILQERFDHDLVEYIDNMISDKGMGNSDGIDYDASRKISAAKRTKLMSRKSCQSRDFSRLINLDADDGDDDNDACVANDSEDDMASMLTLKSDYESFSDSDDFPTRQGSSNSNTERQNDFPEHWTRMDNSKVRYLYKLYVCASFQLRFVET